MTSATSTLIELGPVSPKMMGQIDTTEFVTAAIKPTKLHYLSRNVAELPSLEGNSLGSMSLAIQALHRCYAAHVPFGITPDWIWYMIIHEIAEHVKQNADKYGGMFTDSPDEKQMIEIVDDSLVYGSPLNDWGHSIGLFRPAIEAKLASEVTDLFLPRFSTTTDQDEIVSLVAFMDTISPYYNFAVRTRCDIPQIRLDGSVEDWDSIVGRVTAFEGTFPELNVYLDDLLPVLAQLRDTVAGRADERFWKSIYKRTGGSGGPYITGWITALFAHTIGRDSRPTLRRQFGWRDAMNGWGGLTTDQLPTHLSSVPFTWDYLGTKIPMRFGGGVTSSLVADGFVTPQLGFAVAEMS